MPTPYETINQYILDDVRRPDLQEVINRRIQRALLKYHHMDMWSRDLVEQCYVFQQPYSAAPIQPVTGANSLFMTSMNAPGNQLYIQRVKIADLTRFRFFKYVRKWMSVDPQGNPILDPVTGAQGTVASGDIFERNPDSMFDGYGGDVMDVCYRSGEFLNIRTSTPLNQVFLGYFTNPILNPVTAISSWIATDFPSVIALEVKVSLFGDIGKLEEQRAAKMELTEEKLTMLSNSIRVMGR